MAGLQVGVPSVLFFLVPATYLHFVQFPFWSCFSVLIVIAIGISRMHINFVCVKHPSGSTLSGIHGVPRVHYKGKQSEYYIMVMEHVPFASFYVVILSA